MPIGCVFSCRHPLWGGDGICITDDTDSGSDPTVDGICSCGDGFISRDGAGYPGCVPKAALVTGYTILGVWGLLTTAFLLWHANRYRYLSGQCRGTRRAGIRIRALVSGRWVRRTRESMHCLIAGIVRRTVLPKYRRRSLNTAVPPPKTPLTVPSPGGPPNALLVQYHSYFILRVVCSCIIRSYQYLVPGTNNDNFQSYSSNNCFFRVYSLCFLMIFKKYDEAGALVLFFNVRTVAVVPLHEAAARKSSSTTAINFVLHTICMRKNVVDS